MAVIRARILMYLGLRFGRRVHGPVSPWLADLLRRAGPPLDVPARYDRFIGYR